MVHATCRSVRSRATKASKAKQRTESQKQRFENFGFSSSGINSAAKIHSENLPSLNLSSSMISPVSSSQHIILYTYHLAENLLRKPTARISACLTALRGKLSSSWNYAAEIQSKNRTSLKWSSHQLPIIFSTYHLKLINFSSSSQLIILSIHVPAKRCTLIFLRSWPAVQV